MTQIQKVRQPARYLAGNFEKNRKFEKKIGNLQKVNLGKIIIYISRKYTRKFTRKFIGNLPGSLPIKRINRNFTV